MAWGPFSAEEIEASAETLRHAAAALQEVADGMRAQAFDPLWLQAGTAFNQYCSKLHKLAMDAKAELRDQYTAAKRGVLPRWKINQQFNQARDEAKADRVQKGIQPKPKKRGK